MSWVALVPAKARSEGKSRLRGALADGARVALVRLMLDHVLRAASGAAAIERVVLVSPERDSVDPALPMLLDLGRGLNAELDAAVAVAAGWGARGVLVLHADLPGLTSGDVAMMVAAAEENGLALAPDHRDGGTNAIALTLPTALRFRFGPGSFARHRAAAAALGLTPAIVRSDGLAHDLDEPESLAGLSRE